MSKTENNSLLLFISAFSLGALFAYFNTPVGSEKWRQLSLKWDEARDYLFKQGLIKDKNISLEEFRKSFFSQLSTSFASMKNAFESKTVEKELAHLAKLKRRRTRTKKHKFKGV